MFTLTKDQRTVFDVMQDGKERTAIDVMHKVKLPERTVRAALRKLAIESFLKSITVSGVAIYQYTGITPRNTISRAHVNRLTPEQRMAAILPHFPVGSTRKATSLIEVSGLSKAQVSNALNEMFESGLLTRAMKQNDKHRWWEWTRL